MLQIIPAIFLSLFFVGCESATEIDAEPFECRSEKTVDKLNDIRNNKKSVAVRFDGVPFG